MLHLDEVTDVSKCVYEITEFSVYIIEPTLMQGCTNFPKIKEPPQNYRRQYGEMQQVPQ